MEKNSLPSLGAIAIAVLGGNCGDSPEVGAAISKVETDMFEADLAYRQAYARLTALMGARP